MDFWKKEKGKERQRSKNMFIHTKSLHQTPLPFQMTTIPYISFQTYRLPHHHIYEKNIGYYDLKLRFYTHDKTFVQIAQQN